MANRCSNPSSSIRVKRLLRKADMQTVTPRITPCITDDRLLGLVVKASASIPACAETFPGRVIPVTYELALQWLASQAPGVVGSALGLVGWFYYTVTG